MIVRIFGFIILILAAAAFLNATVLSQLLLLNFKKVFVAYMYFAVNMVIVWILVKTGMSLMMGDGDESEEVD